MFLWRASPVFIAMEELRFGFCSRGVSGRVCAHADEGAYCRLMFLVIPAVIVVASIQPEMINA
jgi:hypothetical protein